MGKQERQSETKGNGDGRNLYVSRDQEGQMETYFSKSGAKSAALDSFVNPVTYRVFLGMLVVFLLERKTLCVGVGGTGVCGPPHESWQTRLWAS